MKTDIHGKDFEPVAIRTSTIHSRIEGNRCIEGCLACKGLRRLVIHTGGDCWYEEIDVEHVLNRHCACCEVQGMHTDEEYVKMQKRIDEAGVGYSNDGAVLYRPVKTSSGKRLRPLPVPNWRSMTNADYDQFLEWVDTNTLNRWQLGKERYQSDVKGFQGDPIDLAIEKMFDGLLYLWMAKRQQGGL